MRQFGRIITPKIKTIAPPSFAPFYDSARGLLWNMSDENVIIQYKALANGGKKIIKYIEGACPRISINDNSEINHFGLIKYLKNNNESFGVLIEEMASSENEERVLEMLNKEFYIFFIEERRKLITHIIKQRFKIVREV